MNDKISIIIPVYNVEKYLCKCVDSVLAQTYTNLEVILVDDGSPDSCPAICDEYAAKDERIVVVHQLNMGVSAARNAGLDIATGEYIGFVDSDDWIEPDMYEVLYTLVAETGADISVVSFCKDSDKYVGHPDKEDGCEVMDGLSALREVVSNGHEKGKIFCAIWPYLIKRNLFVGVRFPVEIGNGEDRIVGVQLFYQAQKVAVQKYACYHWYTRACSAIHSADKKQLSIIDANSYIDAWISERVPELKNAVAANAIRGCIAVAFNFSAANQFDEEIFNYVMGHIRHYRSWKSIALLTWKQKVGLLFLHLGRKTFDTLGKLNKFLNRAL